MRGSHLVVAAAIAAAACGCSSSSSGESNKPRAKVAPAEAKADAGAGEPESSVPDAAATIEAFERASEARRKTGVEFYFLSRPLDGWLHVAEVEPEAVRKTPAWDDKAANPPLSARKALELADAYVSKYEQQNEPADEVKRELRGITLVPYPVASDDEVEEGHNNRWVWVVSYEWYPAKGFGGGAFQMAVPVLMDGTVVPVVRSSETADIPAGTGLF